ncbi:MAG: hypothetical protein ACK5SX_16535 [Sandaracinobacter sp.]
MQETGVKDLGEKALLLRIIGAGVILVLLLWTVLVPPANGQGMGGARASAPAAPEPELPATDLLVRFEGPALSFRWSLAPEAALEPAFVRALRADALAERAKAMREQDEAIANPPPGRGPIRTEWWERWQAEAETDGLIVLSARTYEYTGGAHGNLALRTAMWDRAADRRIAFADLFADPRAALAALQPSFCKELDAQRLVRRQGVRDPNFSNCPPLAELPVVPVGNGAITSLRVLVPPYMAGPWVEGVYEIALETTPILPHLSPRFAGAFAKP